MASEPRLSAALRAKLRRIRCVVMDVDGVLTDGRIILDAKGNELKFFDAHDGYGIVRAQLQGIRCAIITGRSSPVVRKRAAELGIRDLFMNVADKERALRSIFAKYSLSTQEVCCIGDDEPDLAMLAAAGVSAAPSSAVASVRRSVDYVTRAGGGRGAVRELLDLIDASQSRRAR